MLHRELLLSQSLRLKQIMKRSPVGTQGETLLAIGRMDPEKIMS
jgi:hypothetical protein